MATFSVENGSMAVARQTPSGSFDCASRDETAGGSAQDDNFYVNQTLKLDLYVDTA